ncbi:bacteriophage Gp15 family protein [Clostridium perfringens]|nr:bacteriophage Gp15 family protein [Clostridium perfringens]EJT6161098.1 bacteriophage Gp15 family protein [Clostridium perfringens]EJT6503579.1 bacteriophage Gp15 family protein [Clostridium perfringens]
MNILVDLVPEKVKINGKMYKINSDFRTSILFELLMDDEEVPSEILPFQALQLYYPKLPPKEDFEEAINKIMWFYGGGREDKEVFSKGNGSSSIEENNIYSFEYDDEYIYSAFLSQYNIDLQDIEYLHWWKFKAMFKGLSESHKIMEIIKYRSIDLSKIEDKKEKEFYKEMKNTFKLPDKINKSESEKLKSIEDALANGGVLNI